MLATKFDHTSVKREGSDCVPEGPKAGHGEGRGVEVPMMAPLLSYGGNHYLLQPVLSNGLSSPTQPGLFSYETLFPSYLLAGWLTKRVEIAFAVTFRKQRLPNRIGAMENIVYQS